VLKSTPSNLPSYYLSFFPITVGVANTLERFQMDFLWGSIGGEVKFHLVNWRKICTLIKSSVLRV
jgi:hypothetical protein